MSLYFAFLTVENYNKNKKYVKFQGDMLIFYDFIQVFVFTANRYLKPNEFFQPYYSKACVYLWYASNGSIFITDRFASFYSLNNNKRK